MDHRRSVVRAHVRLALLSGVMGCGALAASLPTAAVAGDLHSAVPLNIPSQDLGAALAAFANQADVQIIFTPETVAGMRSGEVSGKYTPEQALRLLLTGGRLEYIVTARDSVLVRRVAAASGSAAPAAKPAGQAPENSPEPKLVVEEFIVTAQKREQRLDDVPLSISLVDGDRIVAQGIRNLEELSSTVANLKIAQGGQADQLQVRGVGSGFNPGFEQAVATFVDGLYRSRSRATRAGLFDLERVEVLKGPQSTFFGNNAIAGALNITTKKPGDSFVTNTSGLYSPDDGEYNVEVGASLPVSNALAMRVAAKVAGMDGYITNISTGDKNPQLDDKLGRVTLVYKPSDAFDVTLRSEYGDLDDKGTFDYELLNCPADAAFGAPAGSCARYISVVGAANVEDDLDGVSTAGNNFFKYEYSESGLTANVRFGGHVLTSVTGFFHHEMDLWQQGTGVAVSSPFNPAAPFQGVSNNEELNQFSQELRLSSATGNLIDYMVGLYYQRSDIDFENVVAQYNQNFGAGAGLAPFFRSGDLVATHPRSQQDDDNKSAFAALTFNFGESTRLNLGARYSDVDKTFTRTTEIGTAGVIPNVDNFVAAPLAGQALIAPRIRASIVPLTNLKHSDSKLMPSASLQYDFTEDAGAYLSYTNGFKAGGYSFNASATTDTGEFDAETVDAYELGFKAAWFGRRLTTNIAVFDMKYSDLQETTAVSVPGSTVFSFVVTNVAESTSRGVELGVHWRPTSQFTLATELAYLDAQYDKFSPASCTALQSVQTPTNCTQDLSGRTRTYAPKYSGSLSGEYRWPITANLQLSTAANVYYTDDYFFQANLDPSLMQEAYAKVGARLAIASADDDWEIAVIGKNLTDKTTTGFRQSVAGSSGSIVALTDRPRSIAIQGRYRW